MFFRLNNFKDNADWDLSYNIPIAAENTIVKVIFDYLEKLNGDGIDIVTAISPVIRQS